VTRRLLNIASIVCLVLCVALMGMWVRSYSWVDQLHGRLTSTEGFSVGMRPGRLQFGTVIGVALLSDWQWGLVSIARTQKSIENERAAPHLGFAVSHSRFGPSVVALTIPCWFLVLTSGSLAMLCRLRWPWQFKLRTLFVVTTFLAVVLGMIAWLDRAWIGK
jgi:hypothetical protein